MALALPLSGLRGLLGRTARPSFAAAAVRSCGPRALSTFCTSPTVLRPGRLVANRPTLLFSAPVRAVFNAAQRVARSEGDASASQSTALATLKDAPKYTGWRAAARKGTNVLYVTLGVAGLAVAGGLLYNVGSALFTPSSEFKLQALALERMEKDAEVVAQVGVPMQPSAVQAARYMRENTTTEVTQIKFLVTGPQGEAQVMFEGWLGDDGKMRYSYIVVSPLRRNKRILVSPFDADSRAPQSGSRGTTSSKSSAGK